ncbi:MAG TPA: bifunctional 3-(3-hydroxy-phenyl)propionate/3-hydroxycinnamic acid hydroxylase [Streptosporangiaceae bacterium]|nr:bifunctional 3-(3-hydroxy-phenyl)propionate/3-hydroxycinnamic acid hydroxylase [Streptosporangiaceae bacterium]
MDTSIAAQRAAGARQLAGPVPGRAGALDPPAERVDVAVVGYGPVGAMVANLLGQCGVRTAVLEKDTEPYNLPRAGATDDEVVRICQAAGLADELLGHLDLGQTVQYVSGHGRLVASMHPAGGRCGYPRLAFFYQPDFERVLRRGVQRYDCVSVAMGLRAEALCQDTDGVTVWARHGDRGRLSTVRARYVVGCDGGRSTVRSLCSIGFAGATFAQPWLVVDAEVDAPVNGVPCFQFIGDPRRPAVTLPLPGGRHRWEFMVLPGEDHNQMARLETAHRLISPWAGPGQARILRHTVYTFHSRCASQWRSGRVLLAGDAAHLMPPFAGQGLSSGIRDAHNLCWKLAAVISGEAGPGLLDSYERERRPHVARMTWLTRTAGALVQTRSPGLAAVRDAVLSRVGAVPRLGPYVQAMRFKPPLAYSEGAFHCGPRKGRGGTGRQFPQPRVRTAVGRLRLLDDLFGPGWALLGCGIDPQVHLGSDSRAMWATLGARYVTVVPAGRRDHLRSEPGTSLVEDLDGYAVDWFARYGGDFVVLRPDRVVFVVMEARDLDSAAALYRELIPPAPGTALRPALTTGPATKLGGT